MSEIFWVSYRNSRVFYRPESNLYAETLYCVRSVIVCKIGFPNRNTKLALLRVSMVVTCYIQLFQTGTDRHNGILMSLLLLVAETKTSC